MAQRLCIPVEMHVCICTTETVFLYRNQGRSIGQGDADGPTESTVIINLISGRWWWWAATPRRRQHARGKKKKKSFSRFLFFYLRTLLCTYIKIVVVVYITYSTKYGVLLVENCLSPCLLLLFFYFPFIFLCSTPEYGLLFTLLRTIIMDDYFKRLT